jgi:hypothetical protein
MRKFIIAAFPFCNASAFDHFIPFLPENTRINGLVIYVDIGSGWATDSASATVDLSVSVR